MTTNCSRHVQYFPDYAFVFTIDMYTLYLRFTQNWQKWISSTVSCSPGNAMLTWGLSSVPKTGGGTASLCSWCHSSWACLSLYLASDSSRSICLVRGRLCEWLHEWTTFWLAPEGCHLDRTYLWHWCFHTKSQCPGHVAEQTNCSYSWTRQSHNKPFQSRTVSNSTALGKVLVRSLEIERTVATFLETEACVICWIINCIISLPQYHCRGIHSVRLCL